MKIPKLIKRLCPKCKKHTEHRVLESKRRTPFTAHPLGYGGTARTTMREGRRGMGNLGKFSRKAISNWKRTGKKLTKKTDLRYECSVCKKMHIQRKGIRATKLEIK